MLTPPFLEPARQQQRHGAGSEGAGGSACPSTLQQRGAGGLCNPLAQPVLAFGFSCGAGRLCPSRGAVSSDSVLLLAVVLKVGQAAHCAGLKSECFRFLTTVFGNRERIQVWFWLV